MCCLARYLPLTGSFHCSWWMALGLLAHGRVVACFISIGMSIYDIQEVGDK